MFEFHGWVNISCTEDDLETLDATDLRQTQLCDEIQEKISKLEWCNGIFRIFRGVNGQDHLIMTGCANHHQQDVIDLLHWIADKKSDSYGVLHVMDNDRMLTEENYGVRTWRLIKDSLIEFTDPILSAEIKY